MDTWTSQSSTTKQTMLASGSFVVGIVLVIGFRSFTVADTNSLAGFLLGLLLLVIGASAFLKGGKQTIIIDSNARRIVVENANRFSTKKRIIPFSEIAGTSIGYLGKKSNYVSFYYIILKLKSGKEYPLFSPGYFFEGSSERSVMEDRRLRLEGYIKQ